MLLYHGTSYSNLKKILKEGIKPRSKNDLGNWKDIPSKEGRIYLTDSTALYYAYYFYPQKSAILEINTDKLNKNLFGIDEDYCIQLESFFKRKCSLKEISKNIDMKEGDKIWKQSLENIGSCSYKDFIPVSAISRYVVIDWQKNPQLELEAIDICPNILRYYLYKEEWKKILTSMDFCDKSNQGENYGIS